MPRRSYAAIVTTTDHYVGQVLDKLDELGLSENTIVIFQSDNGHSAEDKGPIDIDDHASGYPKGHYYSAHGGGGNTGKWIGHKGTFLEGGIRVPSIVSWPAGLPKGIVRDQAVTIMDWYPSLLEWCEIDDPGVELDGRSLQPIIDSPDAPSAHPVLHFQWQNRWAVREGDWKLIGSESGKGGATLHQLYHLAGERPEQHDHAGERPELVDRLARRHADWAKGVSRSSPRDSKSDP